MTPFDIAFDRLLGHEGGYVNDPNDPGGETNWGISKRSYPDLDIARLTRDEAKEIYRRDFWVRVGADQLAPSVAFQAFDFAVNSGCETAVRMLQRAVGAAEDGHWGPRSRAAAASNTATDILLRLNAYRLRYMTDLGNWTYHGKGWARRISDNLLYAAEDS